jgi:hypothetical protein
LPSLVANQLHRIGQNASCLKVVFLQKDVLGQLETVKAFSLSHLIYASQEEFPNLQISTQLWVTALDALGVSQRLQLLSIWRYHCHCEVLLRIAVQKDLRNQLGFEVLIFNSVRGKILTLLQFEDIFAPVDYTEAL